MQRLGVTVIVVVVVFYLESSNLPRIIRAMTQLERKKEEGRMEERKNKKIHKGENLMLQTVPKYYKSRQIYM